MREWFDVDAFGRLVERVFGPVRGQSKQWVSVWLTGILVVTAVLAISGAPALAYVVMVVVAVLAAQTGPPPSAGTP